MIAGVHEVRIILGKSSLTAAESEFVQLMLPQVERAIKTYLGYSVEKATYTEFYPRVSAKVAADLIDVGYDVSGGRAVKLASSGNEGHRVLYLNEVPIRSVTGVWEDLSAYYGEGSSDFASSTALTLGTDYTVAWESGSNSANGICKSGKLYRIGSYWPTKEGTVKVTYSAGYTADELATGIAAPIKEAVLLQMQHIFARRGSLLGPVESERLGDHAVKYAGVADGLTKDVKARLRRFVKRSNWL